MVYAYGEGRGGSLGRRQGCFPQPLYTSPVSWLPRVRRSAGLRYGRSRGVRREWPRTSRWGEERWRERPVGRCSSFPDRYGDHPAIEQVE